MDFRRARHAFQTGVESPSTPKPKRKSLEALRRVGVVRRRDGLFGEFVNALAECPEEEVAGEDRRADESVQDNRHRKESLRNDRCGDESVKDNCRVKESFNDDLCKYESDKDDCLKDDRRGNESLKDEILVGERTVEVARDMESRDFQSPPKSNRSLLASESSTPIHFKTTTTTTTPPASFLSPPSPSYSPPSSILLPSPFSDHDSLPPSLRCRLVRLDGLSHEEKIQVCRWRKARIERMRRALKNM